MKFEAALSNLYQSKNPSGVPAFRIAKPLASMIIGSVSAPSSVTPSNSTLSTPQPASPEEDIYDDFINNLSDTAAVNIRLSAVQISALKRHITEILVIRAEPGFASARPPKTEAETAIIHLSAQDVISALIISTINRFDAGHISQIATMVNVSRSHLHQEIIFNLNLPNTRDLFPWTRFSSVIAH